jgi:hypothetical protein
VFGSSLYSEVHPHLSLTKDAAIPREVERVGRSPCPSWADYTIGVSESEVSDKDNCDIDPSARAGYASVQRRNHFNWGVKRQRHDIYLPLWLVGRRRPVWLGVTGPTSQVAQISCSPCARSQDLGSLTPPITLRVCSDAGPIFQTTFSIGVECPRFSGERCRRWLVSGQRVRRNRMFFVF